MKIDWFELAEKIVINCIYTPLFVIGLILTFIIWTPIVCVFYGLSQLTLYLHKLDKRQEKRKEEEFEDELDKLIEGLQTEAQKNGI